MRKDKGLIFKIYAYLSGDFQYIGEVWIPEKQNRNK